LRAFVALGKAVENDLAAEAFARDWWLSMCASWLFTALGQDYGIDDHEEFPAADSTHNWSEYLESIGDIAWTLTNMTHFSAINEGLHDCLMFIGYMSQRPDFTLRDHLLTQLGRVYVAKDNWSVPKAIMDDADRAMREHYERSGGTI
jgi:hypothetical protein